MNSGENIIKMIKIIRAVTKLQKITCCSSLNTQKKVSHNLSKICFKGFFMGRKTKEEKAYRHQKYFHKLDFQLT